MADNWLFVFQIQGESIMSRFWLSVKLEMAIKQTKQLVLRDVCVSTFLCCLVLKSYDLKWNMTFSQIQKCDENMHFICIFQRLETNPRHHLRLQITWLSWPTIHLQCPCAGAVLLSPLERLLAIQSVVHLWAPTMPLLYATYKCKLRTKEPGKIKPFGLVVKVFTLCYNACLRKMCGYSPSTFHHWQFVMI